MKNTESLEHRDNNTSLTPRQKERIREIIEIANWRGLVVRLSQDNSQLVWTTPEGEHVWTESTDNYK